MKYLNTLFVVMLGLMTSVSVQAVSLIDFTDVALTTAATDIVDTGEAASLFVLPIIVGIVAIIVGIKLFKRFSNKI